MQIAMVQLWGDSSLEEIEMDPETEVERIRREAEYARKLKEARDYGQTEFDKHIEDTFDSGLCPKVDYLIDKCTGGRWPEDLRDCAVFAVDALNIAWLGAQAVFEGKAKPEHALAIYSLIMDRLEAIDPQARRAEKKTLDLDEFGFVREHASKPETLAELVRKHASSPGTTP